MRGALGEAAGVRCLQWKSPPSAMNDGPMNLLPDLLDAFPPDDESPSVAGLLGRRVVLASALAAAGALALDEPAQARSAPLAVIYRGPASEPGTPEAAAWALRHRGAVRTAYVGPRQSRRLTAATLRGARLYVQPGGGSVEAAWPHLLPYRRTIVDWVRGGGHYLGLCLGGYLAANDPGFGLWPGRIVDYKSLRGADIARSSERLATIRWRGRSRTMYVEDPPVFALNRGARRVTVLARYRTGHIAAASVPVGRGRVTVVGPHPEAPPSWTKRLRGPRRWDPTPWIDTERTALS